MMDRIRSRRPEHLRRWVIETCRSEFCHWIAIAASPLFFLWNRPAVGFVMIIYSLLFNLPLVIVQRHNRPRFLAAVARTETWRAQEPPLSES